MKCRKCRNQLRKGAKFCPACGARVVKRKGRRIISILLVIILLLSIVAIGAAGGILLAKNSGGRGFFDIFSGKKSVKINSVEEAVAQAKELGEEFGYKNAMSEMTEKVTTEIDGDCYYRLQQNYQGIPVYGRNVIYVAGEEGNVVSVTGNPQDTVIEGDLIPSVTWDQVSDAIKKYQKEVLGFDDSIDTEIEALNEYDLNIYNCDGNGYLVYRICVNGYEFLVDAHSAEIWFANCLIRFATVNGNLQGQTQIYKDLHYTETNNVFSLEDSSKCISVYTANNQFQFWKLWNPQWVQVGKDLVTWSHGESADPSSVDAFANVQIAYDYFNSVLNNKSTDGKGEKQIRVITGVLDLHDNACFSPGEEVINVGKAKNYSYDKSAYIDWIAHEYMHGVEYNHSGMNYSGESGAVMEGLSDIFGELVESWSKKQDPNWIFTETQRNMISPSSTGYPASYHDSNWANTEDLNDDHGGVHTNNTVITHATYLMWHGINNDDSKKIDTDKLAKLWYRAMLMMPSDCDFATCRQMVEWAALSVDGLTKAQRDCIAEAFDMVGIHEQELSPEILMNCDRNVRPGSKLNVYNVDGDLHSGYTLTVSGTCAEHELAYAPTVLTDIGFRYDKTIEVKKAASYPLDVPNGYYTFTITDHNNPQNTYSFTVSISNQGTDNSIELHTDFKNQLIVKVTEPPVGDAYKAYIAAARETTKSGNWSESLTLSANMTITDGSTKTKTKVTMTSDANITNYSESDPSKVRMSGDAEMSAMGQTYAWSMRYENGTAHYQYTKPYQTSADLAIDPGFFNFGTMTSDMMTKAKISGNQITFTVPGDKITAVGIAAVNQMSGVEDLMYGDVDVSVKISEVGTIDTITMVFHASLKYQGYDADVDYDISYQFSESTTKTTSGDVFTQPGYYVQDGNNLNTLTVHAVSENSITFSVWWYRIWDITHATATLRGNVGTFDYVAPNNQSLQAKGNITFLDDSIVMTLNECTHDYVDASASRFKRIGVIFTEKQLKDISSALGVPENLDVEITQGEPGYWEGGGIYRTEISIYNNGVLIAGASVNSLTGDLAGNIYVYSAPVDTSGNSINITSTFGFDKAWDIHDRSGTEHFVTSIAFSHDGTFCCAVGWYLSDWYVAFTGTYQVNGDEIILKYMLDDDEKMSSYQMKWEKQTLKQTSEENIVIAHQSGSEYPFEENPWYTADELRKQVETFMHYNG